MTKQSLLIGALILTLILLSISIALAQMQEPSTSPLISNGIACVQFNNPPPFPGGTYPVYWDVFKVALNGGNPCNYPNLFIGDLRSGETAHLVYYNGYSYDGDSDSRIGPYTQLYVVNSNTILGVINAPSGLTERTYYELVGNLPVVYVNFTVSNAPQPTVFMYVIDFINDIYVDSNPGETSWVVALGVGNYSFPAQHPREMYNLAINWGFDASLTPDQITPGYWAKIYIPASAGKFAWMEINQPGVGTYYLALYPLTPIEGYFIASASGWGFDKLISLVFANNTVSASGALLVVYGTSLSNLQQNINEALIELGIMPVTSTVTVNVFNVNGEPATTVPGVVYGILVNDETMQQVAIAYMNTNSQLIFNGISPGTYTLYVYHYPNTGLNYTEYWGNLTINVAPGQSETYSFTRDMPWIDNVYATQSGSGAYTISVVVDNPQSTSINGIVTVYVSSQKGLANAQTLTQSVTLSPGMNTITFTYTPSQPGTYYAYVVLQVNIQQPITTDQYGWAQLIQAVITPSTTSTSSTPNTSNETVLSIAIIVAAIVVVLAILLMTIRGRPH